MNSVMGYTTSVIRRVRGSRPVTTRHDPSLTLLASNVVGFNPVNTLDCAVLADPCA
jgi:hypothetical protein